MENLAWHMEVDPDCCKSPRNMKNLFWLLKCLAHGLLSIADKFHVISAYFSCSKNEDLNIDLKVIQE